MEIRSDATESVPGRLIRFRSLGNCSICISSVTRPTSRGLTSGLDIVNGHRHFGRVVVSDDARRKTCHASDIHLRQQHSVQRIRAPVANHLSASAMPCHAMPCSTRLAASWSCPGPIVLTCLARGKGRWSQATVNRASHSLRKPHLLTRTGLLSHGQASSCGPSSTVGHKPAKKQLQPCMIHHTLDVAQFQISSHVATRPGGN